MTVQLLTEHHLGQKAAYARLSLHMLTCQIVGNHMSRLNYFSSTCSVYSLTIIASLGSSAGSFVSFMSEKLKIKRNDWLLVDTCPQAANHCALF